MTRVRVCRAAGAGRDPPPIQIYHPQRVSPRGAERHCAWQPTTSAVAMATDRLTELCTGHGNQEMQQQKTDTMVAEILRLIAGGGVSGGILTQAIFPA
jgi:hypothetical protein